MARSPIDAARLARALAAASWPIAATTTASTSGRIGTHTLHTSVAARAAGDSGEARRGLKATLLAILTAAPAPGLSTAAVCEAAGAEVSRTRVKRALQELKAAGRVVARPPAATAGSPPPPGGGGGSPAAAAPSSSSSSAASKAFLFTARLGAAPAVGRARTQQA